MLSINRGVDSQPARSVYAGKGAPNSLGGNVGTFPLVRRPLCPFLNPKLPLFLVGNNFINFHPLVFAFAKGKIIGQTFTSLSFGCFVYAKVFGECTSATKRKNLNEGPSTYLSSNSRSSVNMIRFRGVCGRLVGSHV